MSRDFRVHLDDILEAIRRIQVYTHGMAPDQFFEDEKTFDAVVRNLEVIGEAVKQLPRGLRTRHRGVDWKKIAGLRDILIHEYFGIDREIIWDIVQNKIPGLDREARRILADPLD